MDGESLFKTHMSTAASRYLLGDGLKKYIRPNEELYIDLEVFAGQSIFSCKAVELKVILELDKRHVWRKIVVPVNITFSKLHKVLQLTFGWKDYHLHEFYIYNDEKSKNSSLLTNHPAYHREGYKNVLNLVSDEEAYDNENDIPMKLEKGIKLSECIPKYKRLKYNYDFGDNWQHYMEVEGIIEDYDKNYPVCLEGEGNTPPEDDEKLSNFRFCGWNGT